MLAFRETIRKVERLHVWDVARANKAPFAFGIEPRVPFLDKAFLQTSMSIDPQDKMVRRLKLFSIPERLFLCLNCHPYTGNSETSGDSKTAFLHCGDVVFVADYDIITAIVVLV